MALLALLAIPAAGLAATKTYVGKTEQGYRASAKVVDGKLKWVKFKYRLDCKDSKYTYGPYNGAWVDAPEGPIEQERTRFSDSGSGEDTDPETKHKLQWTAALSGRILSGGRIKATHTETFRLFNSKGKEYDRCRDSIDMRLRRKKAFSRRA
jgi:hypothetical protein